MVATATIQIGSGVVLSDAVHEIKDRIQNELLKEESLFQSALFDVDDSTIVVTGVLLSKLSCAFGDKLVDISATCLVPREMDESLAMTLAGSAVYRGAMTSRLTVNGTCGTHVLSMLYGIPKGSIESASLRLVPVDIGSIAFNYKPTSDDDAAVAAENQPISPGNEFNNAYITVEFTMSDRHDPEDFIKEICRRTQAEFHKNFICSMASPLMFSSDVILVGISNSTFTRMDGITQACGICVHLSYNKDIYSDAEIRDLSCGIIRNAIDGHPFVVSSVAGKVPAGTVAACLGATVLIFSKSNQQLGTHHVTWESKELVSNMNMNAPQDQPPVTPLQPDPVSPAEATGEGAYYDAVNEKNILLRECKWIDVANVAPPEGERVLCQTDHENYTQTAILTRWGKFWFRADTHVPASPTRWACLHDLPGNGDGYYK
jgi:hypothetical protein